MTAAIFFAAFAAAALAQNGAAGPRPGETVFSAVTVEPGARIESRAVVSSRLSSLAVEAECIANPTTLCLNNGRFQVRAIFSAPNLGIHNAPAQAVPMTGDTGYFWFFTANNVELVVKVVDGRAFNGFFWAFYGALSDVLYTITITDTQTNAVRTYSNPAGRLASVADVTAFPGGGGCAFTVGNPNPSSFGSSGGSGSVTVTTAAGCNFTASASSSGLTITSGLSYTGSSTVTFQVGANSSTSPRTLSMTIAGQTVAVTQAGQALGGIYDGTWIGTTSQGKAVSWTIAGNAFTEFRIGWAGPDCGVADGSTTVTYSTPRPITGTAFTHSSSASNPPIAVALDVAGTFHSAFGASGSATATITTSAPMPACSTNVPITFTATKS